ncbi:MAG TPA: hypothetical protein VIQ77_03530 [Mucilaginibacter sp.]|jgi:hypothetical protein
MPKSLIIVITCLSIFSCQQKENIEDSRYQIIFVKDFWCRIDLKSKILTVDFDSFKFKDTLKFTSSESQEISEAFNKRSLTGAKGKINYYPTDIIMPAFYETINIYKDKKFASAIRINTQCKTSIFSFGTRSRAIKFRDVVNGILDKNLKFIKARNLYQKYMSDHRL